MTMKIDKKPDGRGGARPGAGRKPSTEDIIPVQVCMPRALSRRFTLMAKAEGLPRWKFLAKLLDATPTGVFRE